jgi:hypothetical protein
MPSEMEADQNAARRVLGVEVSDVLSESDEAMGSAEDVLERACRVVACSLLCSTKCKVEAARMRREPKSAT